MKVPNSFIGSFDTDYDGNFPANYNWSYTGKHYPDGDTTVYEYTYNNVISNNNYSDTTLDPVFSNLHVKSNIGITDLRNIAVKEIDVVGQVVATDDYMNASDAFAAAGCPGGY